jgi:hypothetical protein
MVHRNGTKVTGKNRVLCQQVKVSCAGRRASGVSPDSGFFDKSCKRRFLWLGLDEPLPGAGAQPNLVLLSFALARSCSAQGLDPQFWLSTWKIDFRNDTL